MYPTTQRHNDTMNMPHLTEASMEKTLHPCDPQALPWAPWAMEGAWFKLLSADPESGRFSLLIKLDEGCAAPPHRHVGAVEGWILEGGFHYADDPGMRFTAGTYLLEKAGAVHQPLSPEGALMFGVFHGPLEGLAPDGSVTGRIGCRWHIETWNAVLRAI
jgi:anti-sigma factor ChrR (cupin superfamily)